VKNILVDTGPLVAWLDRSDNFHERAVRFFAGFDGALLTTWPVLTEVCHLVPQHVVTRFMKWVAAGGVGIQEMPAHAAIPLAAIMAKYEDRPIDLADASLIWLSGQTGIVEISTLDVADFSAYRTNRNKSFVNVFPF